MKSINKNEGITQADIDLANYHVTRLQMEQDISGKDYTAEIEKWKATINYIGYEKPNA